MRIYLDTCCLSRANDNLQQDRVRTEAEAIDRILELVKEGALVLVSSDSLMDEVNQIPDPEAHAIVLRRLRWAAEHVELSAPVRQRAGELGKLGFKPVDALHITSAEAGGCAIFLSTDDKLVRCAVRNAAALKLRVSNPIIFLTETQNGLPLQDG